jgi:hypothetical protein
VPDIAAFDPDLEVPLHTILTQGPLARRMLTAVGERPDAAALQRLQSQLADCLHGGTCFGA